jgi:hypothetical protein
MAVRPTDGAAMTARGPREFVTTDPRQRIEKCGKGGLLRGHGGSRLCGAAASSVTCSLRKAAPFASIFVVSRSRRSAPRTFSNV